MSRKSVKESQLESGIAASATKIKNLEEEVEAIMSQESDEELDKVPTTPKRRRRSVKMETQTLHSAASVSGVTEQTPRRSVRKSIKPVQDYDEIVGRKRVLRSAAKSNSNDGDEDEPQEPPQPKWTPAKVGRVSQKRGRRSRKTVGEKTKQKVMSTTSESEDAELEKMEKMEVQQAITDEVTNNVEDSMEIKAEKQEAENTHKVLETLIAISADEKANEEDATEQKQEDKVLIDEDKENELSTKTNENVDIKGNINEKKNSAKKSAVAAKLPLKELPVEEVVSVPTDSASKVLSVIDLSEEEDDFGNYLKSQKIDMDDLGLNPLADDDEQEKESLDQEPNKSSSSNSVVCLEQNSETKNNDTFDMNECILIESAEDAAEEKMESLQISDDESSIGSAVDAPKIVITPADSTLTESSTPSTKVVTPRRNSKVAQRLPTPYKKNETHKETKTIVEKEEDDDADSDNVQSADEPPVTISVSTLEPKELVLRSIRKRSLSVCIGDPAGKRAANINRTVNRVTFYSPANQTAVIEELDLLMEKGNKKVGVKKEEGIAKFVTQRRKRSMSFDESIINSAKKPGKATTSGTTPSKLRPTPQKVAPTRTKLPNFAAIHQKQFEKMQNLVEYVEQKAERAKILTSSALKKQQASAEKVTRKQPISSTHDKSKALKKINMDAPEKRHLPSALPQPIHSNTLSHTVHVTSVAGEKRVLHLPTPQLAIVKPMTKPVTLHKKREQPKPLTPGKLVSKPIQTRQALRPAFNLSTSFQPQPVHAAKTFTAKASNTSTACASTATESYEDKVARRRQRHMDMFKGRAAGTRAGGVSGAAGGRNNGEIIRGVRSNRRFELQMQHRQNTKNN